jgi:hypothetical protein
MIGCAVAAAREFAACGRYSPGGRNLLLLLLILLLISVCSGAAHRSRSKIMIRSRRILKI